MPETDSDMGTETARFQAFAARPDDDLPAPWQMRAPVSKIGILIAIVAVAAILALFLGVILGALSRARYPGRVISVTGTCTVRGGASSPARRRISSSPAVRPISTES
jgi:hypothetical protein